MLLASLAVLVLPFSELGAAEQPVNPGDSVNCSDFVMWSEADDWFWTYYGLYGDVGGLDPNNDLIPCQSLPGSPGVLVRPSTLAAPDSTTSSGSTTASNMVSAATDDVTPVGYWLLESDGTVYACGTPSACVHGTSGQVVHHGDAYPTGATLPAGVSAVAFTPTPSGAGYLILLSDGSVTARGDAVYLGDPAAFDVDSELVSISSTPTGNGYWIFSAGGAVFTFGDAAFLGSASGLSLVGPIVSSVPTPSGFGYYALGSDGGVFTFGDAAFHGSIPEVLPGRTLDCDIVGIVPTPTGLGYWLVACDGGVFAFGDAVFTGSLPGVLPIGAQLVRPVNGMVAYGDGYLMVASDGGAFNFGAAFFGSLGAIEVDTDIVAIAPARAFVDRQGDPLPSPTTGPSTTTTSLPPVVTTTTSLPPVVTTTTSLPPVVTTTTSLPPVVTTTTTPVAGVRDVLSGLTVAPKSNGGTYDRAEWRHWIDDDGDCQDTRQEVLFAEAVTITATTSGQCRVSAGTWIGLFTGQSVTDPSRLDVDHMVPLKNAHESGGWEWTASRKQAYANDLAAPESLIAVTASANRSKGARGPEEWKPPDSGYWCIYATDWIIIKAKWTLTITTEERTALSGMLDTCEA